MIADLKPYREYKQPGSRWLVSGIDLQRFAQGKSFDERSMSELDSEAIPLPSTSESFAPARLLEEMSAGVLAIEKEGEWLLDGQLKGAR